MNSSIFAIFRHKQFKSSSVVFGGIFAGFVINYIINIILARYFGPDHFGIYKIGTIFVTTFATICVLGMDSGLTRYISLKKSSNEFFYIKELIKIAIKYTIVSSAAITSVILIFNKNLSNLLIKDGHYNVIIEILAISIPFITFKTIIVGILRGNKNYIKLEIFHDIIPFILLLISSILVIVLNLNLRMMIYFYLISFMILFFIGIYILKNLDISKLITLQDNHSVNHRLIKREIFSYSLPLLLTNILSISRKKFDILLVGILLSSRDAGIYSVAVPFSMGLKFIMLAVNRVYLPESASKFSKDRLKINSIYQRTTKFLILISMPIFIIIFIFAKELIIIFFGLDYASAATPLRILLTGNLINVISGPFGETLQAIGKTRIIFITNLISATSNIFLLIYLIPKFGINGAAFANFVSLTVMVIISVLYLVKSQNIYPWAVLSRKK